MTSTTNSEKENIMPKPTAKQSTILVGAALVATLITGAITSIVVIRKNRDADAALFVDALSGTSAATDAFEAGFNGN